ncbi:unnamed protein product, partial [Meganyctiphanes norvegica]
MERNQNTLFSKKGDSEYEARLLSQHSKFLKYGNGIKENQLMLNRGHSTSQYVHQAKYNGRFLLCTDYRGYSFFSMDCRCNSSDKSVNCGIVDSLSGLGEKKSSSCCSTILPSQKSSHTSCRLTMETPIKKERNMSESSGKVQKGNAFLYFCAEQREATTTAYVQQTGRTIDKKQLTKLLAQRWNALPEKEKKVYIDRVEKIKEEGGVKIHEGLKIDI